MHVKLTLLKEKVPSRLQQSARCPGIQRGWNASGRLGPRVVALRLPHSHTDKQMNCDVAIKNIDRAKEISAAIQGAGRSVQEHEEARKIIFAALEGTKIPTIKLCDKYLNIEDENRPPHSLSNEAIDVFGRLTTLISGSSRYDLSDLADDLALSHDIKLLP